MIRSDTAAFRGLSACGQVARRRLLTWPLYSK